MAGFGDALEEIEALLSSGIKSSKALAYPTLLHLQERCDGDDESSIGMLARRSQSFLNLMIEDIFDDDEEIAAQACKCLGFMMYHPSIVATISVDTAGLIIQSLAKLIISTKIKSVCNLAVWCISVQQFSGSFFSERFDSVIIAVVHALDNPAGSSSTTFEAIQAIIKLASQLNRRMKETSHVWAPPIYRRLVSELKKERDVSERCLLKLRSMFIPPLPTLAKVVILDVKKKLLPGLKELQGKGLILQAVQAWGWFISLIGPHAIENRRLLNEMLRFLEQTFSDHNPQVKIASLIAWERLIDALINHPIQACDICVFIDSCDQESKTCQGKHGTQAIGFSKSIKLIMTPLTGIVLSKCDASVQSACMKTWCYLLHKLGAYINCPAVVKATLEPILKAVFQMRPDNRSSRLLNLCIDILDDSITVKSAVGGQGPSIRDQVNPPIAFVSAECLWKQHSLKWLPWGINQLEFYMDMVQVLSNQAVLTGVSPEYRSHMTKSTVRIFRSILKGIQVEMKHSALFYDQILLCLNMTVLLIKNLAEDAPSGEIAIERLELSLRLIEATMEVFDLSVLGSPLYKVTLDFSCIKILPEGVETLDVYHKSLKSMGSQLVYLLAVYFCVFTRLLSISADSEVIIQQFHLHLKLILSSENSLGAFHVILSLMYCSKDTWRLKTWMVVAGIVKDILGCSGDVSLFKSEYDRTGYLSVCRFLTYPLVISSSPLMKISNISYKENRNTFPTFSTETGFDQVIEVWSSIFHLVNDTSKSDLGVSRSFIEDLCSTMNEHMHSYPKGAGEFVSINSRQEDRLHYMLGKVVICILAQLLLNVSSCKDTSVSEGISLRNTLSFCARYIQDAVSLEGTDQPAPHGVTRT
uniref:Telomere-associated protein Rif1 N-terminal domain-containing protein n=1 Tax=Kalanchoe fedtschenkoi TaxID=63787 RepID=A0A7N0U100_KALFE